MNGFHYVSLVTLASLVLYIVLLSNVGLARYKFGVKAPAMTGHETFERYVRVHYNTIEQMVLFLPSLWLFAYYVDTTWATGLGVVWLLGRIVYAISYYRDPEVRTLGFALSALPTVVMLVGAIVAIVRVALV